MSSSEMPPIKPDAPLQPLKDLILIKVIKQKDEEIETPGGIIIPGLSADQKKYEFGEVMAIGKGAISALTGQRIEMDVAVGDKIAHVERAGWDFRKNGVQYRVIRETDCWVIMNPGEGSGSE
jgi:chaperonin GroES